MPSESAYFPPIVVKSLRNHRSAILGRMGCTAGLMMSNNDVRRSCEEVDEINEILSSLGEDIPEITDVWTLDVMSRKNLPPSDEGYGVMMYG